MAVLVQGTELKSTADKAMIHDAKYFKASKVFIFFLLFSSFNMVLQTIMSPTLAYLRMIQVSKEIKFS